MRALSIDTSTHRASVVLWENGTSTAREYNTDPVRHAETLVGLIDHAFAKVGWNKTQLDMVACCVGPGSFTGVRVGLATAKGIALGLDRPIVGIGSLEAMASATLGGAAGPKPRAEAVVVALLDARKGEVFWAAYGADAHRLAGPGHLAGERVGGVWASLPGRPIIVVGEVAREMAIGDVELRRSPQTDLPDAAEIARMAVARLENVGADDLDALEPVYVRPPDITAPRQRG